MPLFFRQAPRLFPFGFDLGLVLVLKNSLNAIIEADDRFVVSVQLFRLIPDG